jgi:glycerophosphoryl diester phosphodiesterase
MPRREPENTLPSFAAALAAGAQGIELDVHATADGVVVVHHDPVTRDGVAISATRWSDLREPARRANGATSIPSLASVCDLVAGRAELFVEIKGVGIEQGVIAELDGRTGPFSIHSFDHAAIGRLARRGVAYRLGLLFGEAVHDMPALLAEYGAADAWPHYTLVDRALVDNVQRSGGRVIAWTVNSPTAARRLADYGIDGICTDDVTMLSILDA